MQRILRRRERGAATVEFAIIAIILFLFVFGIIEFGILIFDKHILTNASREGARAGIVMTEGPRVSDAEIQNIVKGYAQRHMMSFRASIVPITTVTRPWLLLVPPKPHFGDELTVNVTYQFHFMFLSGIGLGPINLTAETRMKME